MSSTTWSPRLWALLLMLSGNMLIDALEVSTIVIAMPSIGGELNLTAFATSWFMTGFAVGFGGAILLGARLTARFGRRRVYLVALLVFAIASLASGLADDALVLGALRVVKGVCVALTAPTGLAIIASTFAEGPARTRALSVYSMFGACGFSAGLLLSGTLTLISWRWALLFSGPVALGLFVAGIRLIPGDGARRAPGARGPTTPHWPLLRSAAGAAALNGTYWGFLMVATFELRSQLGWSSLTTGLALLPTSLPLALSALYSGRLVSRFGAGRLIAAGSCVALCGYAWYLGRDPHEAYLTDLLPAVLLVGIGFLLSFSALHVQAITGVPPHRQGVVSGIYQTSVQLGGAAVLVPVAAVTEPSHHPALLVITAVAAAGLLVAVAGLVAGRRQHRKESRVRQSDPSHGDRREHARGPARAGGGAMVPRPGEPAR